MSAKQGHVSDHSCEGTNMATKCEIFVSVS